MFSLFTTSVLASESLSEPTVDRLRDELSLITPESPMKSEEWVLEEEALLSELSDSPESTQTEDTISTSLAAPKRGEETAKEVIEPIKDSKPLKKGHFFKAPRHRSR